MIVGALLLLIVIVNWRAWAWLFRERWAYRNSPGQGGPRLPIIAWLGPVYIKNGVLNLWRAAVSVTQISLTVGGLTLTTTVHRSQRAVAPRVWRLLAHYLNQRLRLSLRVRP